MSRIADQAFQLLFGCSHEFGFPITRRGTRMYQVCVRCGAEYEYDWNAMSRGHRLRSEPYSPELKIAAMHSASRRAA